MQATRYFGACTPNLHNNPQVVLANVSASGRKRPQQNVRNRAISGHKDEAAHQLNAHGQFALDMTDFALAYIGLLTAGAAGVKINETSEPAAKVS